VTTRSGTTISNCTVGSPNFGDGTMGSGNTPVKATVVMGCIGPYEEGTVPRSPIHPITSLYGITTTRSPITQLYDWCEPHVSDCTHPLVLRTPL